MGNMYLKRKFKKQVFINALAEEPDFGAWITMNRLIHDWSSQELADKIHMTKQSVNNMESGRTKVTFGTIAAMCYVFGDGDDPEEIYQKYFKEET